MAGFWAVESITLVGVPAQISAQIPQDPAASPVLKPFRQLPPGISPADLPSSALAAADGGRDRKVELHTVSPLPLLGTLAAWAQARGTDLPDLQVSRPTLEDVYLQLTKEPR